MTNEKNETTIFSPIKEMSTGQRGSLGENLKAEGHEEKTKYRINQSPLIFEAQLALAWCNCRGRINCNYV